MIDNTSLPDSFSLLDPAIQECPYAAYAMLHREAPVYLDPRAGFYVITRYDDIRAILTDPKTYSSAATVELARDSVDPVRAGKARALFRAQGWEPTPTLSLQDNPLHRETRELWTRVLRAGKIRELDPFIKDTAIRLVEDFRHAGACEIVHQLAVPLPLIAICSQVGVPLTDIWKIKDWTEAWVRRFSMMLSDEEELHTVEQEVEFQHYFKDIVDALRRQPDGTVLSDLVNFRLSDGRALEYAEIFSHLMSDLFVGGSETTTNGISEGVLLLCQNPDQYALLMSDVDRYLGNFVDEVLRLQSPVQGLYRVTTRPVTLRGVDIPARALLHLRFAAANRDEQHFAAPDALDITRPRVGSHLAFGSGIHHCIGAPLARREMYWSFSALLHGVRNIRLAPEKNDLSHMPGLMLRALKALHIEFDSV
jgi:cytochrome P450